MFINVFYIIGQTALFHRRNVKRMLPPFFYLPPFSFSLLRIFLYRTAILAAPFIVGYPISHPYRERQIALDVISSIALSHR